MWLSGWARVEGAAGGAGFGTFLGDELAMGFPLGPALGVLVLVDGVGPLAHEVIAQGHHDDHRVDGTVESAIPARLEAMQEQHHLGHLEVAKLLDDDAGQLLHLLLVEFVLHAAIFPQVIELRQHPRRGSIVIIGAAQGEQRRGGAKKGTVSMLGTGELHLGVHHLHEGCQARMGGQQGVDSLL